MYWRWNRLGKKITKGGYPPLDAPCESVQENTGLQIGGSAPSVIMITL